MLDDRDNPIIILMWGDRIAAPGERKVRASQGRMLPNGKAETESATENIPPGT